MGEIKDLIELTIGRLKFCDIVFEYQQGLKLSFGRVVERRKKNLPSEELEKIVEKEKEILPHKWSYLKYLPFCRPKLPPDFRRSGYTGLPVHKDRYSKILQEGLYFYSPIFQDVVKESKQEQVVNLGNITVQTNEENYHDSKSMMLSCNARIQVVDLYKLYTAVHDYEESFEFQTLSTFARLVRGMSFKELISKETLDSLEGQVKETVDDIVTERWGLEIHEITITDYTVCNAVRISHDGQPVNINHKNNFPQLTNTGGVF